jgi:hypothetical protein
MLAVADLVVSAMLVAVTVTVWDALTGTGAVYKPALLMVPTCGLMDQATAVLVLLATVAVNCCVWPSVRATEVGEMLIVSAAAG